MTAAPFTLERGDGPIVVAVPHAATLIPDELRQRLRPKFRDSLPPDTDFHVDRLVRDLVPQSLGVTTISAQLSRWVMDLNRDPSGTSLYPGQATTDLIPLTTFEGEPIWCEGMQPSDGDRKHWLQAVHAPYHAAIAESMDRALAAHGCAVLFDVHSIRSRVARLFDGVLPDLNVGTYSGASCAKAVECGVAEIISSSAYSSVVNGRFKGGWTTRHHGVPARARHAMQLEIAQSTYLAAEAPPWDVGPGFAALRETLATLVTHLDTLARSGVLSSASPTQGEPR